ncbi:TetR family transcriptional regulator [Streptomyces mirabilis]|uniref:TetR/AcrR family transcriptional regulator n=1 Tax=Streptomyces mirabilis TaxID=68239 RepID=UPI00368603E4
MGAVEAADELLDGRHDGQEGRQGECPDGDVDCVRKGERTRRRILEAARRKFAEVGYERATVRVIASEACVDKSSVIQYFGTKGALFREAVHWSIPHPESDAGGSGEAIESYVRGMLNAWAADAHAPFAVLLRAGMTCDEAAELWRDHVTEGCVGPLAATIVSDDARLRAALVSAMLTGIAGERHLLGMADLTAASVEDILRLTLPALRGLIAPDGVSEGV